MSGTEAWGRVSWGILNNMWGGVRLELRIWERRQEGQCETRHNHVSPLLKV